MIIPIDFKAIASEHGLRKGSIFYSPTFKCFVLRGHPEIDLIEIKTPHNVGDKIEGKTIKEIKIINNCWSIEFERIKK